MQNKEDKYAAAIRKLSQYDEWWTVVEYVRHLRDAKFSALHGAEERIDAKVIGAMAEDNYILETLSQFDKRLK